MLRLSQVHLQKVFRDVLQHFPAGPLGRALLGSGPAAQPPLAGSHEGEAGGGQQHPGRAGVEGPAVGPALVHQQTCGGSGGHHAGPAPPQAPSLSALRPLPSCFRLASLRKKGLEGGSFPDGRGDAGSPHPQHLKEFRHFVCALWAGLSRWRI